MRRCLRLAIPLLFSCAVVFGQQATTGSIIGTLKVSGTMPSTRIEVKLETRFAIANVTYADMEGRFSFNDLPPNLYHVRVEDPAYEPVRVDAIISNVSPGATFVKVDLKPIKKADDIQPESRPSGGNPNMVDKDALGESLPNDAVKAFEKGVKLSGEGKVDEAIEKFERAVKIAPAFYQARNNLGSAYLAKGDFAAAQAQ